MNAGKCGHNEPYYPTPTSTGRNLLNVMFTYKIIFDAAFKIIPKSVRGSQNGTVF